MNSATFVIPGAAHLRARALQSWAPATTVKPPSPVYPETMVLRGGVGLRIVKPLMIVLMMPFLLPFGVYGLSVGSYGMAAFFGLPPLLGVLLFAPALARAGSFELTTHRLFHKPWFRERRAYALAELTDLDFDAQTERVRARSVGLDLAFAGSFHRLRGALVVWTYLARARIAPPTTEPFTPWVLWQAAATGRPARRGFAVVVEDLFAFVPETFPPPSVATAAAGLALSLLTLPLGVAVVPVHLMPPIGEVLGFFAYAPPAVRRSVVEALVRLMGGWSSALSMVRCTPTMRADRAVEISIETSDAPTITGHVYETTANDLVRRLPTAARPTTAYRST